MVYFDWNTPLSHMPELLLGALHTLLLTIFIYSFSIIFGIIIGYIRYSRKNRVLYGIATVYVEVLRNTPLLVQLFFLYYGLPQLGIYLPSLFIGLLGNSLNAAAFNAEVFRGGIVSVNNGQWEAAQCVGLNKITAFIHVILPQAIRNIGPSLINQFIIFLYGSSLLSALDIRELTRTTAMLNGSTFRTFELYTVAIAIYYVMSWSTTFVLKKINNRYFPSVSSKGE